MIELAPDFSANAQKTTHTVRRTDRFAIGGLTDGNMYFVDVLGATTFRLLDRNDNPVSVFGPVPNGPHTLVDEGIAVVGGPSGTQRLIVDLTSQGSGTPHVLVGVGGPAGLVAKEDGLVSATATAGGGGLFDLGDSTSKATHTPDVDTTIKGATLRADFIVISADSGTNVAVDASTEGGGFLSFRTGDARAEASNNVTTTVEDGADIFAARDVQILSRGVTTGNGRGIAAGIGLIADATALARVDLSFAIGTVIDGLVRANRTVLVDSSAGVKANVFAKANSAGLGTAANANDEGGWGININGQVKTELQDDARINGSGVFIASDFGARFVADGNGNVSRQDVIAEAITRTSSRATALGADSDAIARVNSVTKAIVELDGGSEIDAARVNLYASHRNVNFQADANASCSCGGGDTDAEASVNYDAESLVSAAQGAIIRTAFLDVGAEQFFSLYAHARRSGGFFDIGDADADVDTDADRTIVWNATVYLLGEPNPVLIVDATGEIAAKTDNVTVHKSSGGPALGIGDVIPIGDTIVIDPIIYDQLPHALFHANHVDGDDSTISGTQGIYFMQETWNSVTVLNASDRPMLLLGTGGSPSVSINTLNTSLSLPIEAIIDISVDRGASLPDPLAHQFDVKHIFPATDLRIESIRGPPTTGFDITIEGDIRNILGSTTIDNDRGSILVGTDAGAETFHSNQAYLDSELGSIGTIPHPVRLVLYEIFHTGELGVPATLKPVVLDGEAAVDIYLELTTLRRSSTTPAPGTAYAPVIGPLKAGRDLYVKIGDSSEGTQPVFVGDVAVDIYTPNNLPGGPRDERVATTNHFRPDTAPDNPDVVGCGTTAPCVVLVALGTDSVPINANYTFTDLRAGHVIGVHHPSTATGISYKAFTDNDATWTDDETGLSFGSTDGSAKIDMSTNGSIWVIEQSGKGDLRVGHIHATGSCTGAPCPAELPADVRLDSPRRIIDAELDSGVLDTDDDPTCVDAYDVQWGYDCSGTTKTSIDVSGRNITMTAGDNGLMEAGSQSGTGGIGLPTNFLEINVDSAGGSLGVLRAFDTAADDDKTLGIYLDEVAGDMKVHTVWTEGDNSLTTGNVSLRSRAGSIVDARNGGAGDAAADVLGQTIDIDAHGGSIGDTGGGNDLEIDSLRSSPFVCTNLNCADMPDGTSDPGLAATGDDVALEAQNGIFLTETAEYLRLVLAHATTGNIRITVRESGATNEDLYLIKLGSARFAEDDTTVPGNDLDAPRTIPKGQVFAEAGSVELRVGDDVTIHQNAEILANLGIVLRGDHGDADLHFGTNMILRGRIIADCVVAPGAVTGHPVGTCAPETNPVPAHMTQIFGNADVDTFQLGDPSGISGCDGADLRPGCEAVASPGYIFLGSKTRIYGSAAVPPLNGPSPGDADPSLADGEDRFTVFYLQDMDVVSRTVPAPGSDDAGTDPGAGHTLTLDGQADTDYYEIRTLGSHGDERNYVINVLDTGAPDNGVDELAIYGFDQIDALDGYLPGTLTRKRTDDIFLLRAAKCIDTEAPFGVTDAAAGVPTTCDATPSEQAHHPAFVALLHGNDGPADSDGGLAGYRSRDVGDEFSYDVQRINYDAALNGRLSVYGLGGNDAFYVDDNSAITTLDGGDGNDTFQIGQIFGFKRDADEGALLPQDTFPVLVATTRGWLSPGIHSPLVATGGTGNDEFTVYSNQAELRLEGDDDNDLFIVRAFALAAVCDTSADNDTDCDFADINLEADPDTGLYPVDTNNDGVCTAAENPGYDGEGWTGFRKDNNGDDVCNKADAHITGAQTQTAPADPTKWEDDIDPARRGRRRAADHRARLLDRPPAGHPRGRRRGRGLLQRQRAGLGRRRHGLRQARRPRHRVRRRHRHQRQGHLRRRAQRPLRQHRGRRGRRARGRRRVLRPLDQVRRRLPRDRRPRLGHDQRRRRRCRGHRHARARGRERHDRPPPEVRARPALRRPAGRRHRLQPRHARRRRHRHRRRGP